MLSQTLLQFRECQLVYDEDYWWASDDTTTQADKHSGQLIAIVRQRSARVRDETFVGLQTWPGS